MAIAFVSWTRYNPRTDLLARQLGASAHFVSHGRSGRALSAPLRYLAQAMQTWQTLRAERPSVILVQNPPIALALLAWLYTRLNGGAFAVDSHTAAFLSPKWRWALPLHRFLSRRALATIVTNEHLLAVVRGWGCRALILAFTPDDRAVAEPFALEPGFNVAVVSTGAEDEPVAEVFAAARRLPGVQFYITGEERRLALHLRQRRPGNCHLTGFLPRGQYLGLLATANVVLDLTTRDHTLLMGAFEAVSLGTPLVVSDWPVLRRYFSRGTVHVANTAEAIARGLEKAQAEEGTLRADMFNLRADLLADWQRRLSELRQIIGADVRAGQGDGPVVSASGEERAA